MKCINDSIGHTIYGYDIRKKWQQTLKNELEPCIDELLKCLQGDTQIDASNLNDNFQKPM